MLIMKPFEQAFARAFEKLRQFHFHRTAHTASLPRATSGYAHARQGFPARRAARRIEFLPRRADFPRRFRGLSDDYSVYIILPPTFSSRVNKAQMAYRARRAAQCGERFQPLLGLHCDGARARAVGMHMPRFRRYTGRSRCWRSRRGLFAAFSLLRCWLFHWSPYGRARRSIHAQPMPKAADTHSFAAPPTRR